MITVTNCTTGKFIKLRAVMYMKTKTKTGKIRKRKAKAGYVVRIPGSIAKFGEICTVHYETSF